MKRVILPFRHFAMVKRPQALRRAHPFDVDYVPKLCRCKNNNAFILPFAPASKR
jgi:hypothetical protein